MDPSINEILYQILLFAITTTVLATAMPLAATVRAVMGKTAKRKPMARNCLVSAASAAATVLLAVAMKTLTA